MFTAIATTLILAVLYVVCNFLYKRTNDYKNRLLTIHDYLEGVPCNLQMATFGSTYSKFAFNNYKELGLNGFNFSIDAEALLSDKRLLEQYAHHLAPGCIVVFCLAACISCCKEEETVVLNQWNYYSLLADNRLPEVLKGSLRKRLDYLLPLRLKNIKLLWRVIHDKRRLHDVTEKWGDYYTPEQAALNMKVLTGCWTKMFKLNDLKEVNLSDENKCRIEGNIQNLKEMADFCKERGWRPVVVIPPMSRLLNGYFSKGFLDATLRRVTDEVCKETDMKVYDYMNAETFQDDISLFVDGGFRMSKYGSLKFMRRFIADLNKDGMEINNKLMGLRQ